MLKLRNHCMDITQLSPEVIRSVLGCGHVHLFTATDHYKRQE